MTQTTTKREVFQRRLENHYKSLEKLLEVCGGNHTGLQIRTISNRLRALEARVSKVALDYANGDTDGEKWNATSKAAKAEIQKYFNGNLQGLKINSDPRGYALKIETEINTGIYQDIDLYRDWGGYGILAPEINGN